jgi:hypothetical protein
MTSMPPIKRHRIASGLKNRTQPYVAYKRLISLKEKKKKTLA